MFSDILSGTLSNILCGILSDTLFDVLKFKWSSIWNPIWHSIWHFIWHSDSLFGIVFGPGGAGLGAAVQRPDPGFLRQDLWKRPKPRRFLGDAINVGRGRSSTLEPRLAASCLGGYGMILPNHSYSFKVETINLRNYMKWNRIYLGYDTAHLWIYHWCISAPDNMVNGSHDIDPPEIPLENAGPWRKTRSFPAESGMIHADSIGIPAARLFCLKI